MMHTPDGIPVVALAICYNGPVDEGERAIKAIRDFGTPIAGEVGPMPYTALQTMLDAGFPAGLQVHWRSEFLTSIPDALIDAPSRRSSACRRRSARCSSNSSAARFIACRATRRHSTTATRTTIS